MIWIIILRYRKIILLNTSVIWIFKNYGMQILFLKSSSFYAEYVVHSLLVSLQSEKKTFLKAQVETPTMQ